MARTIKDECTYEFVNNGLTPKQLEDWLVEVLTENILAKRKKKSQNNT